MNLDTLIIDFSRLNDNIAAAAQTEDDVLLQHLDSEIQETFGKILNFVPKTKEQRIVHCNFLLEHLMPTDNRQGASRQICEKIIQLVSNS